VIRPAPDADRCLMVSVTAHQTLLRWRLGR
jgi:hypothetical protein